MKYFLQDLETYEAEIGGHYANNGSTTEDGNHGVSLHIFDHIGIQHRCVLDIGAYSYNGSSVVPVMQKHNIPGILLDGENKHGDPRVFKVWLTKDNIVDVLRNLSCPKSLDYIALDVDNMDYWLIRSVLDAGFRSNLLIVEFNPIWSYNEAFTKKYQEAANKRDSDTSGSSNYGASLKAFSNLFKNYGYRLIHVTKKNMHGDISCNNAFFIQEKFDTQNMFEDQEKVIQKLFPTPFVEKFKVKNNVKKFGTEDIEKIKKVLKEEWFVSC